MLLKLLHLKFTIKKNILLSKKYWWVWGGFYLLVVGLFLAISVKSFDLIIDQIIDKIREHLEVWLQYFLFSHFALLVIFRFLIDQYFKVFVDPGTIAYLPLRRYQHYLSDLLLELWDVNHVFFLLLFNVFIFSFNPKLSLWQWLSLHLIYLFMIVIMLNLHILLQNILVFFLDFAKRYLIPSILIILSFFLVINQSSFPETISWKNLLHYSPFGISAVLMQDIIHHTFHPFHLLGIMLYLILFAYAGYSTWARLQNSGVTVILLRQSDGSRIYDFENLFREKCHSYILLLYKECCYLFRSPRLMVFGLIALFLPILYIDLPSLLPLKIAQTLIFAVGPVCLMYESISLWFFEQENINTLFYLNQPLRRFMVAKNMAYFIYLISIQITSWFLFYQFYPNKFYWRQALLSIPITFIMFWVNVSMINLFAVYYPKKIPYNTIFFKSGNIPQIFPLSISGIIIFSFLSILYSINNLLVLILLTIITCILVGVVYYRLTFFLEKIYYKKRGTVIQELS